MDTRVSRWWQADRTLEAKLNFPTWEALSGIIFCTLKLRHKVFWQALPKRGARGGWGSGERVGASLLMLS